MPGLAADGRQDGFGGDFADACELFQPDGFFEPVLRGVIRVLQGAAAAVVVIGAGGGDARGRGLEDLYDVCFEEAFLSAVMRATTRSPGKAPLTKTVLPSCRATPRAL